MKIAQKNFENWKIYTKEYPKIQNELKKIENSKEKIIKNFSEKLNFGTAGIRGIMGIGTSLMNIFTVRHITQAISNFLHENHASPSVVISFDTRNNSKVFAEEVAKILSSNGITVNITENHSPTPFLSFCVRELKCDAGIMITASHNPAEYNGYKFYGEDGAQIDEIIAKKIHDNMIKLDIFKDVKICENKNLIKNIDNSVYNKYLNLILEQRINKNLNFENLNVTYTPLNGVGLQLVESAFKQMGIKNYQIVENQKFPDGNFKTCSYPNPEFEKTFEEAIKTAKKWKSDIILATDPDADRLGVCVKDGENYKLLTGNELGVLLFNYILTNKKLPENPICIKSNVSTPMINSIAKAYNCEVIEVLTGFKNIGKEILNLEQLGKLNNFIFSFEESGGYLTAPYCRDKDAVCATILVCEMANFYKKSLILILDDLYEKFGFSSEKTLNFKVENLGIIMEILRKNSPKKIGDIKVLKMIDYLNNQPPKKSDILEFFLENEIKIIVRPSGTEPKLKVYLMVKSDSKINSEAVLKKLENATKNLIKI